MPSPLFRQLCEKTGRQEHALLMAATQIRMGMAGTPGKPWPDYNPVLWRTAGRLARSFLEEFEFFRDNIQRVATQGRFRMRDVPMICPTCGDPDCPEAMLLQELSPAAMLHVQQMMMAKHYKPESPWE